MEKKIETYKGLYAMHKYWGKKPFNQISRFIEKYTEENETVMDCFCGSGVTLVESVKLNRKCIGIDLNPMAIKLTKASLTYIDINHLKEAYKNIENNVKEKIDSLYKINIDGQETITTHTIWKDGQPIEVWYRTKDSKKNIRQGNEEDINMANNPLIEAKWYPEDIMFENSRINVPLNRKVSDLFTKRALVGLSLILDEINKIKDDEIRNTLELTFTGALSQASKLVFVIRGRKKNGVKTNKAEVGSWVVGYWVPEEHFEINVWNCFENRFKRILKGKEDVNNIVFNDQKELPSITDKATVINGSATNIPCLDDSVDYVFIDPPHANRILYMEMSLMWNSWLKLSDNIDWNNEIVISEAKSRGKDKDDYNKLMNLAFAEIKRVLKKDKYFSMAFNCMDNKTWLNTLNIFVNHGFTLENITPLEYSATSVVQDNRKNALKTDFVLTFKNSYRENLDEIVFNENIEELKDKIYNLTQDKEYEVYDIINLLYIETIPKSYIYKISDIINILNKK